MPILNAIYNSYFYVILRNADFRLFREFLIQMILLFFAYFFIWYAIRFISKFKGFLCNTRIKMEDRICYAKDKIVTTSNIIYILREHVLYIHIIYHEKCNLCVIFLFPFWMPYLPSQEPIFCSRKKFVTFFFLKI